jgi:hypothetical protein
MSTNNPTSMRLPFETQIAKLPPEIRTAHRFAFDGILDLNQALQALNTKVEGVKTTATTALATASTVTENITTINNTIFGFTVSNQTGNTAYTVQQSDNGALLLLNDAAPVAVTLDTTLTIPYSVVPVNQGAGLVTLTPSSGTINGLASLTLPDGYFAIVVLDGTNWWAAVLPVSPITFTPIAHEFLTGYDSTTGIFSAAQPIPQDVWLAPIAKSANYGIVAATDYVVICTNAITITLPTAAGISGYQFIIKNANPTSGSLNVDIATTGGQLIDGLAAPATIGPLSSLTVISDNSGWWIL